MTLQRAWEEEAALCKKCVKKDGTRNGGEKHGWKEVKLRLRINHSCSAKMKSARRGHHCVNIATGVRRRILAPSHLKTGDVHWLMSDVLKNMFVFVVDDAVAFELGRK